MPLEGLLELVRKLRERIDTDGEALRQNEGLTRYALIDPLLRELGWNTADPTQVVPEYPVPDTRFRADYVLLCNGSAVMAVESKKLDEPLRGGDALNQGIIYCARTNSRHFLLTDGRRWEIYEPSSTTPVIAFDLKGQPPAEVCLQALALWRPAVEVGHVARGQTPIIEPPRSRPGPTQLSTARAAVTPPVVEEHERHSLAEVTAATGQTPTDVLFPNGEISEVKNWRDALEEIVRWLTVRGILRARDCPIIGSNPKAVRHMVHTQPIHSNGARFRVPIEVNGLWVEKHDSRQALIEKIKTIIQRVGQDPAQFKVRFD